MKQNCDMKSTEIFDHLDTASNSIRREPAAKYDVINKRLYNNA